MSGIERSRVVGMSDRDLDEFICGICHEIFNDPVMTLCCRQTFCVVCIEEWIYENNSCPNDRQRLTRNDLIQVPRIVVNLLSNMNVKCDYFAEGCHVITTFGELTQHLVTCDKKPEIICKTCGFPNDVVNGHNCMDNLVVKINSLTDQIDSLEKQIQEKKELIDPSWGIDSARIAINDFIIEEPSDRIDFIKQKIFIEICQDAILNNNSFAMISQCLYRKINYPVVHEGTLPWHAFVFTNESGESMVKSEHYFRIRFGKLVIELFTAGKLS